MKVVPQSAILDYFTKTNELHQSIEDDHGRLPDRTPEILALRDTIVIATLFFTGARAQEVANLVQADVVASEGTVRYHIRSLKHGVVRDVMASSSFLCQKLKCYRSLWPAAARSPFIFTQKEARPYPRLIHRIVKTTFPEYSPHCFRHTYASILADEAVDIRLIQYCLGHRHLNTTAVYLQTLAADKVGPIWAKFDNALKQGSFKWK
jgi:site-specific recombinase XerD